MLVLAILNHCRTFSFKRFLKGCSLSKLPSSSFYPQSLNFHSYWNYNTESFLRKWLFLHKCVLFFNYHNSFLSLYMEFIFSIYINSKRNWQSLMLSSSFFLQNDKKWHIFCPFICQRHFKLKLFSPKGEKCFLLNLRNYIANTY
jgi:hypothetical protein